MPNEIHSYTQLQRQIHEDLRVQHPEWVEPNGDCPTCESYERRLAELIGLSNPLNATRPLLNSAEPFDLKEYPANMKPTLELTEANFETEVVKSSQPVLVEFATGWSLPSMMLDGAMDEIAGEFVDCLKVGRVNLDGSPNLGLWYGIRCIPTILYFVDRSSGLV